MTREEAEGLLKKYGNQAAAAKALGISTSTFNDRVRRALGSTKATPASSKGRSLAEFRSQYDKDFIVPGKIRAALKVLGAGWEYEVQFARMAGVSLSDLGNYRDMFADHIVTLRESRRAWAGATSTAKAMKEML